MVNWTQFDDPVARLHGFVSGFHATYYVYTGVESSLFEALVDPQTPSDLSSRLGLHEPYVRRFCEIGLRWGLLDVEPHEGGEQTDGATGGMSADSPSAFRLREPFVEPLAVPDSARYMGDVIRLAATQLSEDYVDYPKFFRSGETRSFTERDATFTDIIEGSTRGLQSIFVEKLVPESLPSFEARLSNGGRVLDVGCGTGYLSCRLCERYPGLDVVGVDLDTDAIARARERANVADVDERTSFRVEDASSTVTEVADTFDAAVLFMSLHEIAPLSREAMFEGLGDALVDDGVVAVFDEVYPERPSEFDRMPFANGVETQWSELVWGNIVPTAAEQRDLLATAGLGEQSRTTFADRFVVYEGTQV